MTTSDSYLESKFPYLKQTGYKLTSPASIDYNCFAWAAGDNKRCWDPFSYYWPGGLPREHSLATFIKLYESLGYEVCSNHQLETGYEKIALYVDDQGLPSHAAKQLRSGLWSSKLGQNKDIQHKLDGLMGTVYGKVAKILKKALKKSIQK